MSNEKPEYEVKHSNGTAYIKQREDDSAWEWNTDRDGIVKSSNSLEEAVKDSKNEVDQAEKELQGQCKKDDEIDINKIF